MDKDKCSNTLISKSQNEINLSEIKASLLKIKKISSARYQQY